MNPDLEATDADHEANVAAQRARLEDALEGPGWRPLVDLFCGGGGASTGWTSAGGEVVLAVDNWAEALAIHRANHPATDHLEVDLGPEAEAVLLEAIERATGGRPFHLHGSPPCQALSTAGANRGAHAEGGRAAAVERGMVLVDWFLDFAENRSGCASWSMEQVVPVVAHLPPRIQRLATVLEASDFGVAQSRRRAFVGVGWTARPTTAANPPGVLDALPHLRAEVDGWIGMLSPQPVGGVERRPRSADLPAWTLSQNAPVVVVVNSAGAGPSRSVRSSSSDQVITGPAPTLTHHAPSVRAQPLEPGGPYRRLRSLRLDEALVLQGFPADYDLADGRLQRVRWQVVGNAVCPPVMAAVRRGLLRPSERLTAWGLVL